MSTAVLEGTAPPGGEAARDASGIAAVAYDDWAVRAFALMTVV